MNAAMLTIKLLTAVILAVLLGNGSVVLFNRLPQAWFADWDKVIPPKLVEADEQGRQRIPSTPWKYAFTGLLGICGVYLSITAGLQYEIAVLIAITIILEMAIADELYRIVPDQLQLALAACSVGFINYNDNWWEPLAGAGIGLAFSLAVYGLGAILFHSGSIGGADMKFYICIGFVTGRMGVAIIFVLTTLLFAVYSLVKIAAGRSSLKSSEAMLPSACAASIIYLVFLYNITGELIL